MGGVGEGGRVTRPAAVPPALRYRPFRAGDAVRAGLLSRRQLEGASWRRMFTGVYLHREAVVTHLTWCRAAALLLPAGAAISGASAAYLYGADVLALDPPVEVSVPPTVRLRAHPKLQVTRSRLDDSDVRRWNGAPVTTAVRTAFDLGRRDRVEAVVALDALLRRGLVNGPEVRRYMGRRPGWPGTGRLRAALVLADGRSESPMETRLRVLVVDAGFPAPAVQYDVVVERQRFRLDLAYPGLKLALEYDGDHHRDRATFRRDVARLNALRAAGWTVLRFTADDVRHPGRVVATLRKVFPAGCRFSVVPRVGQV
jgi:very-short-patch-repair endonuclease